MTRPARKPAETASAQPAPLTFSLQLADPTDRALLPRHRVARWLRAALERPAEITVRVVDAEEGRSLNRAYRARDYPTNVLTFHYRQRPTVEADLVLCGPVVRGEAAAQRRSLEAHYAHLVVHGALHALGYDHEAPGEAEAMERREAEILSALGYEDPYAAGSA